jgi:hypothetical protein
MDVPMRPAAAGTAGWVYIAAALPVGAPAIGRPQDVRGPPGVGGVVELLQLQAHHPAPLPGRVARSAGVVPSVAPLSSADLQGPVGDHHHTFREGAGSQAPRDHTVVGGEPCDSRNGVSFDPAAQHGGGPRAHPGDMAAGGVGEAGCGVPHDLDLDLV